MSNIRIIPRLEVKSGHLIKGMRMEGLRKLGDPCKFSQQYFQDGADEIFYEDIVASLYNRSFQPEVFRPIAESISVPLCVAGGIRSKANAFSLLKAGADKLAINTHAIKHPELIKEVAHLFGSQCIAIQLQAKKQPGGRWNCYTLNGRENTGKDVVEWAQEAEELGAGEIVLISVDQDGMQSGPDLKLIRTVVDNVSIPVVAGGGIGSIDDIESIIHIGGAQAVSISHTLHFKHLNIRVIKKELRKRGVSVRICDYE